jgi:hypothetical protein
MQGLRNRLTYANVMSTIAVFLVLGGATAVAASKLGKNTVGTKQLKANSVTAAKLKRNAVTEAKLKDSAVTERKLGDNAITTAKIADGAVTGAKVQAATLGTVPNAATFSGYSRRGIVRVGASPTVNGSVEESRAASPEVPLFSSGPFTIYAKCFDVGASTSSAVFIKTSQNGSILDSSQSSLDGAPFLNPGTLEVDRELRFIGTSVNSPAYSQADGGLFAAMAPDGTVIHGDLQLGVKNGNPPGGNGVYGNGNICLFAGEMTALNG